MSAWFKQFSFALTFLTRIPFPVHYEYEQELPAKSMAFYPLVGSIIALLIVLVNSAASLVFSPRIVNVLILIFLIYITGGLHLDGFMDTIDGFFSGRKRERILEIMHDSRVGSFGVIAVFVLLLLKFNLLMDIQGSFKIPLLFLMSSLSRWQVVFVAFRYPLTASSKIGKSFTHNLGWREPVFGGIWLVLLSGLLNYFYFFPLYLSVLIFIFSLIFTVIIARLVTARIGGLTGDVYGAVNEIIEVFTLLSFLFLLAITNLW